MAQNHAEAKECYPTYPSLVHLFLLKVYGDAGDASSEAW
jgi:hypothetical protein